MSTPIDTYLAKLDDATARKTLTELRAQLRRLLPKASEELSYGMPAFRLPSGKVAAGFAFFGKRCGYYPHSGNVVGKVTKELAGFSASKGGVTFPPGQPLPQAAVRALVRVRLAEIASPKPTGRRKAVKKKAVKKKKKAVKKKVRTRTRPEVS
jgi:uncharacterized protein YdhG (YjbR/CyaY superfamily)